MKIDGTGFGWIKINGIKYDTDVIIFANGEIENRYRNFRGDNHLVSQWEVEKIITHKTVANEHIEKPEILIVGTGQAGIVRVTDEAKSFLAKQGIKLIAEITPTAIEIFNKTKDKKAALFHVTC
ncbi:MAG: MTH938/NDUFAF3 family protein [candidate division WOR-3 bacterium]